MARDQLYQARVHYTLPSGETIPAGTVMTRDSAAFEELYCVPLNVRGAIETTTAAPGEQRRTKVTRAAVAAAEEATAAGDEE